MFYDKAEAERAKRRAHEQFPEALRNSDPTVKADYWRCIDQANLNLYLSCDRYLDGTTHGPRCLAAPEAKHVVLDSWKFLTEAEELIVYAISVMSNHVHVLLESKWQKDPVHLSNLLRRHKRFTGFEINKLLHRTGERFWAEKEYLRSVRHGRFESTLWYILNNPVKAGLTNDPLQWYGNWYNEELVGALIRKEAV